MDSFSIMPGPQDILGTSPSSTPQKQANTYSNNTNTILFAVSFVFLTIVLLGFGWKQWRDVQLQFTQDMQRTVDGFVAQASLTAKASTHANQLFVETHKQALVTQLQNQTLSEPLWKKMNLAFFHLTGFILVDKQGQILNFRGAVLGPEEHALVSESVTNVPQSGGFFAHHYGESGGYYAVSWFELEDTTYGLVIRRPYNKFSEIIHDGQFTGFTLALYDKSSDRIIITQDRYYQYAQAPNLNDVEGQVSYRRAIASSPWELLALEDPNYLPHKLQSIFLPNLIILVVFIAIATVVTYGLNILRSQQRQRAIEQREIEQRAEKSLASIDEAVFTTDKDKRITYVNPKAAFIFSRLGHHHVVGSLLPQLWPAEDALWYKDLTLRELEILQDEQRELQFQIQNENHILEQSYNLLYDTGNISGIVWVLRDVTDSVRNRRALEESRSRYKAIFEEAAIAHCVLVWPESDALIQNQVRINTANDAAVQLFKAQDQEHLVHAFPQLIGTQLDIFHSYINIAIENHKNAIDFELTLKDFSGEERILWSNISFKAGARNNALITFIDITDQKNATTNLKKREQFWAKIMNDIPDMVYVVALDAKLHQTVEYCNRSIGDLLGLKIDDSEEIARWNIEIHEEDKQYIKGALKQIRSLQPGQTTIQQARAKRYDGSWRIFRFTNTAFSYDEDGYVCRYISTARDVTEEVEAQEQLIDNERQYRLLAENVTDIIWAVDTELNFTFISSSVFGLLGYKSDELYRTALTEIFSKGDLRKLSNRLKVALGRSKDSKKDDKKLVFKMDMPAACKNGRGITVEIQANYLWGDENELTGLFGILRDVTEARKLERELILAGQVFDNSNEAILVTDSRGHVINANQAFFDASLFSLEEIRGARPDDVINSKFHGPEFYKDVGNAISDQGYWQGEVHYLRRNGEERVSWTGVSATKNKSGFIQNLIIIVSDITERKVIEQRIHKLAYYDPLTGLPNRSQMHERLDQMVSKARQDRTNVAVLFLDLDRFKPINDSMGHPAGDRVLKEVASRLQNCIKKQDLVSRMSGDEFTIAISGQPEVERAADTAVKVGERILHSLQQPFLIEKRELFVTGSIGIAIFPHDGQTVTELLKNADMAMYHAKDDGRNNVQFFDAQMNKKAVDLLEMENDLRHAVEREEFEIYYQPQYHTHTTTLSGVEALLRWNHPTKGIVSPADFIPIIEDTGLIIPIGEWVLRKACSDLSEWQQQGLSIERIAVNVSAKQFKQAEFVEVVKGIIEESGIKATQLELELTESILIDDVEHTLSVLSKLRDMGVRMAIDDFGTGYSSLNYLKQFPVDILKIDQSFIRNLPGNAEDGQITRTIVAMAHNLGLGVIAEGVETFEQLAFLKETNCEEVQGFYFSKPVPVADLISQCSKPD